MLGDPPSGIRGQVLRGVKRFLRDDRGQDLVEYALLTAIVGLSGVLAFAAFSGRMGSTYRAWNDAMQAAWRPPPPG